MNKSICTCQQSLKLVRPRQDFDPFAGVCRSDGYALQRFVETQDCRLPALPEEVCLYIMKCYKNRDLKCINSALWALHHWHERNDFPDPTSSRSVQVLSAFFRKMMYYPRQALEKPCSINELIKLTEAHVKDAPLVTSSPKRRETHHINEKTAKRNKAIILIAFWFGMTLAQVCKLRRSDIRMGINTLGITIPIKAAGRSRQLFFEIDRLPVLCPLTALEDWTACSEAFEPYMFTKLSRGDQSRPISSQSVSSYIIKISMGANIQRPRTQITFHYGLYFFVLEHRWTRRMALKYLPFYRVAASKTRAGKTIRSTQSEICPLPRKLISEILSTYKRSRYYFS